MKQIAVSSSPVIILKYLEPTDIYFLFFALRNLRSGRGTYITKHKSGPKH